MKLRIKKSPIPVPGGQADPFMFEHNGMYYVYATLGQGVQLYRSDALDGEWEYLGLCFSVEGMENYWAPSVIEIDGKIYMYVSTTPANCEDAHQQAMKVAVADKPEGPFQFIKQILPPFSIDSHVIRYNGDLYIFYSSNDEEADRPGTYVCVDKMLSPTQVEGNPKIIIRPTMDEEIFMRDRFKPGVHWHTIEGAFYFRQGDTHYITYSGSCYGQPTYFVGYSVAHGDCDDLRDLQWHKYPDDNTYYPLLRQNEFVEGTGHNSVIDIDGQLWIVYHGRDRGLEKITEYDSRTMRADKLHVDADKLWVNMTP